MIVETAEPAVGNTAGEGVRHGACGILGGADGTTHRYALYSGNADRARSRPRRPASRSAPATASCSNPAAAAAGANRPAATPTPPQMMWRTGS